jgi:hypothetical protein
MTTKKRTTAPDLTSNTPVRGQAALVTSLSNANTYVAGIALQDTLLLLSSRSTQRWGCHGGHGVRRGYARIPGPGRPVGGARGLGISAPPQGPHGGGARSAATGEEEKSSQGREKGRRRRELGVDGGCWAGEARYPGRKRSEATGARSAGTVTSRSRYN